MPLEVKPIFRPHVIRLPILGFSLPDSVTSRRHKLEKWAEVISTGSVYSYKEQEILGDFLNDVFCEVLDDTRAVDSPKRYTVSREKHVQANGKFADAVLGEFGPGACCVLSRQCALSLASFAGQLRESLFALDQTRLLICPS